MPTYKCEPGKAEEVSIAQVPNPASQRTVINDLMQPGLGAREEDGVDHVARADGHHEDVHPLKVSAQYLMKVRILYDLLSSAAPDMRG